MEIVYFSRQQGDRFSIEKVTSSIIKEVSKTHQVKDFCVPDLFVSIRGLLRNILYVRSHRTSRGINHITGDIHYCMLGLIGTRSVLTVHDTVFLTVKQSRLSYFIKWLLWLYLPCLLASKIICISENTKKELVRFHINPRKIAVIYDPVELDVSKFKHLESKRAKEILHIGTKDNKNLPRVIKALEGLPCKLHIVGQLTNEQKKILCETTLDYYNDWNLTDCELVKAYLKADIISFPSTYEGFGMPIIEGQLAGAAVLTSNIPPMTEVGGESVEYVDPFDVASIRQGFANLLYNEMHRGELIKKGGLNATRFCPATIAKQYVELYKKL